VRQDPPFWQRDAYSDRRALLQTRDRIASSLRAWLRARDFIEVETAILQVSPGNETHLHALATELSGPGGERQRLHLRTSPEFACKKLLAAGEPRIFEFARVFRDRERGALHHPEFTMLEWYRANQPYDVLMDDCAAMLRETASAMSVKQFKFRNATIDPLISPERLTVAAAFDRYARINLLATIKGRKGDPAQLQAEAARAGVSTAIDDTWGDIFSRILAERVEPNLGFGRPTILYEYPVPLAALARAKPGSEVVAERFELYVCGVELANGFGELTDVTEQRARFETAMDEKERIYGERYPVDADFLAALGQMPQASGVALGFDRLVMLATGAERIDQVIWTPVPRP
jgi:lysyl-tRNA synthetase class 2